MFHTKSIFGEIPIVLCCIMEGVGGDGEPTYDLEALIALTLRSNACIGVEAAASVDVLCSSLLEEADRSESLQGDTPG